jgi:hypothetical protein
MLVPLNFLLDNFRLLRLQPLLGLLSYQSNSTVQECGPVV